MPRSLLALSLVSCVLPLSAQTTLVVDPAGGPGVFSNLPSAVAFAATGDTILVLPGLFGEGATPFVTNKGLTIVGVGGAVPITTSVTQPIEVSGLPAGASFRLRGFRRVSDGEVNILVQNCAGEVHIEDVRAREPDFVLPSWPAIQVVNSAAVTLRGIENFGNPAVLAISSRVSLVRCRLGVTSLGVGGGLCLEGVASVLDVVQPEFRPATAASAILTANCLLTIGGDGAAVVSGGQTVFGFSPAIVANGGSVSIDPAVGTPTFPAGAAPFAGTAPVVVQSVPASWTATAQAGQTLAIESSAAAGSVVFQCLGSPAPHVGTPLGVLGIDAGQPLAFFAPTVLPASGRASFALPVPAALPSGSAFATQAVVLTGGTLGLGLPTTFVLR